MAAHYPMEGEVRMPRILRAAAMIVSACSAAAGTLKEAWSASAMGGASLRYRPEAHYMRGPGPKWFAKHAQLSTRNFERLEAA
jgi:hypothetical protein